MRQCRIVVYMTMEFRLWYDFDELRYVRVWKSSIEKHLNVAE